MSPGRPCYEPDLACRLTGGEEIRRVGSVEGCQEKCVEEKTCQFFTFYRDLAGSSLAGECHLSSSCHQLVPLTGALTGSRHPDCTCSLEVEARDGDLLLAIPGLSEVECIRQCRGAPDCTHYLYLQSIAYCKLLHNPQTFTPSLGSEMVTGGILVQ